LATDAADFAMTKPDRLVHLGGFNPMSPSTQVRIPAVTTEFVNIPGTQLKVSRVALGTWAMGGWMWGGSDQRESIATMHAARNLGINLIDTAPLYSDCINDPRQAATISRKKSTGGSP
jgi:hypothetical protein